MKFTISKTALVNGLSQVVGVVPNRSTLPILANVLIRTVGELVEFTANDLDTAICGGSPATVQEPGASALPARRLLAIAKELPSQEVTIEVSEKNVASIRCGQSFFKINGLPADEFPPIPEMKDAQEITIAQADLRDGLRKTMFAVSTDGTRYTLNGVLCEMAPTGATLVATDGRRLASVEVAADSPGSEIVMGGQIIIPTKCAAEILRLIGDIGNAQIEFNENQIKIKIGDVTLASKLIDGNYPNYRQVMPEKAEHRLTFSREELLSVVKRVSILSSEKTNSVRFALTAGNVEIASNTPDIGEARESIAVKYSGPEFAIAFNPEYLMQALRALSDSEIYLDLTDALTPAVIRLESSFLYVLMPMRIS